MQKLILEAVEEFNKKFIAFENPDIVDGFAADQIRTFLKQALTKSFEAGQKSREKEMTKHAIDVLDDFYDYGQSREYMLDKLEEGLSKFDQKIVNGVVYIKQLDGRYYSANTLSYLEDKSLSLTKDSK